MARTDRLPSLRWALALVLLGVASSSVSGDDVNGVLGAPADAVNVVLGNLPPGKTITVRFGARIANPVPPGVTQVSYQGTVSGTNLASVPTDDPATGAPRDPTVTPLNGADLSVTKSGLPNPVIAGGIVTYTIAITNAGPEAAQTVALVDVVPATTAFQSLASPPGWTCTTPPVGGTGTVSCTIPTLAIGSTSFTLVVAVGAAVPGGTSIVNTATLTSATADPNPGNEVASSLVVVGGPADLGITKSDSGPIFPGSNVVYRLVVTNYGPDPATAVSVTDVTPAGLSFVGNAGDCTTPFPCSFASLGLGESRTITATFHVPAGYLGADPIVNTAAVGSAIPDPNAANDTATTQTPVNLPATGLGFHTIAPCRLFDTRDAPGSRGGPALQALGVRVFPLAGVCGIPPTAKALSVNITVTEGSSPGHVLIYSSGPPPPIVSSTTNYSLGQTRGNNAIVSVNRDGDLSVFVVQASGTVHVVLDVNGYFQ